MKVYNIFRKSLLVNFILICSACTNSTGLAVDDARANVGSDPSLYVGTELSECGIAKTVCVINQNEFLAAIASKAEVVVMADGIYDFGPVEVSYPVTIKAANLWGALINGSSYLIIKSNGVSIQGLRFEDGASASGGLYLTERFGSIEINGDLVELLHNYFENIGVGSTVSDGSGIAIQILESNEVLISDNTFNNLHGLAIKTDDFSSGLRVINNDYTDSVNFGGAGEVLHLGNANSVAQGVPVRADDTNSLFENNYIRNWHLEAELISVKSSSNKIINNVIEDSGPAAIVIRMGNNNIISGNTMTGNVDFPVRISGEGNSIRNNVFCGSGSGVSLHAERVFVEVRPDLFNSYWAAVGNTIDSNTYYGYSSIVDYNEVGLSGEPDMFASAPIGNSFKNNDMNYPIDVVVGNPIGTVLENNTLDGRSECPL